MRDEGNVSGSTRGTGKGLGGHREWDIFECVGDERDHNKLRDGNWTLGKNIGAGMVIVKRVRDVRKRK